MKIYQYYTNSERIIVLAHDKSEACLIINKNRTDNEHLVNVEMIKEINPKDPKIILWLKS